MQTRDTLVFLVIKTSKQVSSLPGGPLVLRFSSNLSPLVDSVSIFPSTVASLLRFRVLGGGGGWAKVEEQIPGLGATTVPSHSVMVQEYK